VVTYHFEDSLCKYATTSLLHIPSNLSFAHRPPIDSTCSRPSAHEFILHEITMFGSLCKCVYFVTCNNLARINGS